MVLPQTSIEVKISKRMKDLTHIDKNLEGNKNSLDI